MRRIRDDSDVLWLLMDAADAGLPCPTNRAVADAIGARSHAVAVYAIIRLEYAGFIDVTRYQRGREITITATGQVIGGCNNQPSKHVGRGLGKRRRDAQTGASP